VIQRLTSITDNALAESGQFEQAIEEFDKGNALAESGQLQQAVESYDKALKIKHDLHEAWNNRSAVLLNLGSFKEALESFDKVLQIKPDFEQAIIVRTLLLGVLKKP